MCYFSYWVPSARSSVDRERSHARRPSGTKSPIARSPAAERLAEISQILATALTFVSVTQSFNTTTSMGRLTLNILLSFAQFEREVIGERIRDKFAASRKKGSYEVKDRKLTGRDLARIGVSSSRDEFQGKLPISQAVRLRPA